MGELYSFAIEFGLAPMQWSRGWGCVGWQTMEGQTGGTGQWLRHPTGMSHTNKNKEHEQDKLGKLLQKLLINVWCSNISFKYDWSS